MCTFGAERLQKPIETMTGYKVFLKLFDGLRSPVEFQTRWTPGVVNENKTSPVFPYSLSVESGFHFFSSRIGAFFLWLSAGPGRHVIRKVRAYNVTAKGSSYATPGYLNSVYIAQKMEILP